MTCFHAIRTARSLALLGIGAALSLQANVFTVYSTGAGTTNVAGTPYGTVVEDANYTVIVSPGAGCQDSGAGCSAAVNPNHLPTVVDQPGVFPLAGNWAPDDTSSAWISLYPGNYASPDTEPAGFYVYQTSFNLPSNTSVLSLSGIWDTDNEGFGILLNPTSSQLTSSLTSFNSSTSSLPSSLPFNITAAGEQPFLSFPPVGGGTFSYTGTSGFVTGKNYLDFIVWNQPQSGGNPEGLRVQFTSATAVSSGTSYSGMPTPEPGLYGTLAVGLAGLAFGVRRRRRAARVG